MMLLTTQAPLPIDAADGTPSEEPPRKTLAELLRLDEDNALRWSVHFLVRVLGQLRR